MDQRGGMDQLQRAGRTFDSRNAIGDGFGRGHGQQRTNAFAAGEQAVPPGAMDDGWILRVGGHPAVQRRIHPLLLMREVFRKRHAFSLVLNGCGCTSPARRVSISTRVSASSSCLRQASLSFMPCSNRVMARYSARAPAPTSVNMV